MEKVVLMGHIQILTMDLIHAIESGKIMLAHTLSIEIKEEIENVIREKAGAVRLKKQQTIQKEN